MDRNGDMTDLDYIKDVLLTEKNRLAGRDQGFIEQLTLAYSREEERRDLAHWAITGSTFDYGTVAADFDKDHIPETDPNWRVHDPVDILDQMIDEEIERKKEGE